MSELSAVTHLEVVPKLLTGTTGTGCDCADLRLCKAVGGKLGAEAQTGRACKTREAGAIEVDMKHTIAQPHVLQPQPRLWLQDAQALRGFTSGGTREPLLEPLPYPSFWVP